MTIDDWRWSKEKKENEEEKTKKEGVSGQIKAGSSNGQRFFVFL